MSTLSEDDTDESDNIWQQVFGTNKRRLTKAPKMHVHKKFNSSVKPNTLNVNQFQLLDDDDDIDDGNNKANQGEEETAPKPPPIFIHNVENIKLMTKSISKIIPSEEFNYKSMRDGQVRLMIKTIDSYRKAVKYFESKNISFHTYQLKQERAYRVVIKGLHHSTPLVDIKTELIVLGHQVRNVFNMKSKITKTPLPMFLVDIDPNLNNKEIYNIKILNNAIVTVEPPKREDDLIQCFRCQQFGHTKSFCKKPFKCVKCGENHPTAECKKDINTPPKCVHCLQNHTANYKGCKIYQELVHKKRSVHTRYQPNTLRFHANPRDFPQLGTHVTNYSNNANGTEHISYSQAARGNVNDNDIKVVFSRLEAMLDKLMNLMTVVITKLCK